MANIEQQDFKKFILDTNESKQVKLPTAEEIINWIDENENPDDPELIEAEKIIDSNWETWEITKLDKRLVSKLVENRKPIVSDSLILQASLDLRWLKSMTPDVAEQLSKFTWDYLFLAWLNDIDETVINVLSEFNWRLVLNTTEYWKIYNYAENTENENIKWKIMLDKEYINQIIWEMIQNESQNDEDIQSTSE